MKLPQEIAPGLRLETWKASPSVRWFYIKHVRSGGDLCAPFVSRVSNKAVVEECRRIFTGANWNRTEAQLLRRKRIGLEVGGRRLKLMLALSQLERGTR